MGKIKTDSLGLVREETVSQEQGQDEKVWESLPDQKFTSTTSMFDRLQNMDLRGEAERRGANHHTPEHHSGPPGPRTTVQDGRMDTTATNDEELPPPKRIKLEDTVAKPKVEETSTHREELPPVNDAQFLRWAAKEIQPHNHGNSRRLSMLAAVLSDPATRKSTLKTALDLLKLHHARLEKQVNHIKSACEEMRKNGKMSGATETSAAIGVAARPAQEHFDRFVARVDMLEATFESL
jgi:hypothetical protein